MACQHAQETNVNTHTHPINKGRQTHVQRVPSHVWLSDNAMLHTLHTRILKIDKYWSILTIVHHSHPSHLTLDTKPVQFIKNKQTLNPVFVCCRLSLLLEYIRLLQWDISNQCSLPLLVLNSSELKVCGCRPAAFSRAFIPHYVTVSRAGREPVSTLAPC